MKVKQRKIMARPAAWLGGLAALFLFLLSVEPQLRLAGSMLGQNVRRTMAEEFSNSIYESFLPAFSFVQEKRSESIWFADRQLANILPLYGYTLERRKAELRDEAYLSLEEIMFAESQEEMTQEEMTAWEEEMQTAAAKGEAAREPEKQPKESIPEGASAEESFLEEPSMEELLQAENEAAIQAMEAEKNASLEFVPHTKQVELSLEEVAGYEQLVKKFYTVDSNTMAGKEQLDASKLLSYDMTISREGEEPQILIYHTHSQEAFADSVPGDSATSIMGVGERLAELLKEEYGYRVLHHMGQYDVESRDDAYSAALPAIEQVLAENPSIEVIIDLHRDQMPKETRLVMDLDGRPTARFMFFNGLSRTRKTGDISYLYNENQEENLAFSFQMKWKAEEYYPGLTRKNYLKGYRYNMHLRPKTLLVELGAQNNTVEEAMNACAPLAHILDMVLSE